jgi:superfamily II DNA or RNA helicase
MIKNFVVTLRKYQARGKALVSNAFARTEKVIKAVILCIPTGGGKTVVFADMTKSAIANGVSVLIICNRKELIKQAKKKLNDNGLYPTLIVPGYRATVSSLYLASVDTLRNYELPSVGLVIIDECHLRDFDEIALEYKHKGVHVIGCTATPVRSGKRFFKEGTFLALMFPDYTGQLGNIYDEIVIPTTIAELLNGDEETGDVYLVPAITYGAEVNLDIKKTNTKDGVEFNEKQMFNEYNKPQMYGGVVDKWLQLTPGTKTMCFCINVEHSKAQAAEFNARGIKAAHVDAKCKDREKIFEDFEKGVYQVLCNVAIATTGYDCDLIETIIVNRMTMSLSLWLQMCGRGARPNNKIGKTYFNIIDMGGNVYRHGFWETDREWSLDLDYISKTVGVAPIRECDQCQALIPATSPNCKYCGMVQEKKAVEAAQYAEAQFVVLDSSVVPKELKKPLHQMSVEELERYRELKEYSIGWIVRQLIVRDPKYLYEYASLKNYSEAWVRKQKQVAEKGRDDVKQQIWDFIQKNLHISDQQIQDFATKKLKANHSIQEIELLIPMIIKAAKEVRENALQ